jgi:hypothetical protein
MGAEHVRGLVAEGANVMATDILDAEGRALADELGSAVMYRHLDVTDGAGWETIVAPAEEAWGPVKVLVNNAGIVTFGPIDALSPSDWQRTIDINLTGVFLGMRAVVPSMKRANGGAIVNISSTAGMQGYANLGAYVASKWGVRGLTKTAAIELGPVEHPGELDPSRPDPDPDDRRAVARHGRHPADHQGGRAGGGDGDAVVHPARCDVLDGPRIRDRRRRHRRVGRRRPRQLTTLRAADLVDTHSIREAAVLGGIVRCILDRFERPTADRSRVERVRRSRSPYHGVARPGTLDSCDSASGR